MPFALRWMVEGPADGPCNMARDEAILLAVSAKDAPATLRFYRWSSPTISLGYFQSYSDYAALPPPAGSFPVVRRLTGGGAILHDIELTYSLTLPLGHPLLAACGPSGLYEAVHQAFARVLVQLGVPVTHPSGVPDSSSHRGPFFCFERHSRYDLLADGRKLMGSAQRRTRAAVLQHGSLILENQFDQQQSASVANYTKAEFGQWLPDVAVELMAGPPGDPGCFTAGELQLADQLHAKYVDPAWTRRR
jgi:lipoate-protein ligase A